MNHSVLVDNRIAVWRECAAQGKRCVELPILIKVDDAQCVRAFDRTRGRLQFAPQKTQDGRLTAAVGSNQADASSGRERKCQISEECAVVHFVAEIIERDKAFALTPAVTELDVSSGSAIARRDLG